MGFLFAFNSEPGQSTPPVPPGGDPPDIIVQADGGGDHTTIQAGINAVSAAGQIVEVRANSAGGSQTFTENILLNSFTQDGTSGNECILRARQGDTIAIEGATAGGTRLWIQDTSYWIIDGFKRVGANTWNNTVPIEQDDPYECDYGIRVDSNSQYITIQNLGDPGKSGVTNKVWGANNFTANQTGSFGTHDGASHIKFYNCHFALQGNNNNTGGSSTDWGDLLRIATPNTIIEDCTGFHLYCCC